MSKGMLNNWSGTMTATSGRLENLFQVVLGGCSAQDNIDDCEKVAHDSRIFWPSSFPLDCAAIEFNIRILLDSVGMLLAMATCAHNIKKGKQQTKMLNIRSFGKLL